MGILNYTVEEIPASRFAYDRHIGEYGSLQQVELMESFKVWVKKMNLRTAVYGIPQDNPSSTAKEKCRYDVGIMISGQEQIIKSAQLGIFNGGRFAVFLIEHTEEPLKQFWGRLPKIAQSEQFTLRTAPIVERYKWEYVERHVCELLLPIE